jgi:hypothetical protein
MRGRGMNRDVIHQLTFCFSREDARAVSPRVGAAN